MLQPIKSNALNQPMVQTIIISLLNTFCYSTVNQNTVSHLRFGISRASGSFISNGIQKKLKAPVFWKLSKLYIQYDMVFRLIMTVL